MGKTVEQKKIDEIHRMMVQIYGRTKWITKERFLFETKWTLGKLGHLQDEHPELFKWRKCSEVDSLGRTVRRGILIDYDAFLALHTSPLHPK